ncbi:MAG TPA: AraC family transcriptional regulator [Cyclobacteriaceae bacterium]
MRYQKFQPSSELIPFIECYYVWEGETNGRLDVESPPSSYSAIVFNYGDPTWAYQHSANLEEVPDAFVAGMFTSIYHRVLDGKIGMAAIVFKPTALHNFFGLRMSQLVNNRMALEHLLGSTATHLYEKIKNENTDAGRIRILEKIISPLVPHAKTQLSIIDEAIEYIDELNGISTVDEVASKLKISKRYLEKKFLEKVGLSPKFYSRIKRFSVLANKAVHAEKINWQDVIFESGLHDQSHLVKEYIEFNKMNPSDYYDSHNEMIKYVKPEPTLPSKKEDIEKE